MDYGRNLYQSINNKRKDGGQSTRTPQKKAYKPKPPFRAVEGVEGQAWIMLSRDAVWLLMEFYREFNGYNRSNLSVTYGAVKGRISNGTFNKAIWELVGYGFLDIIRRGRLERNASIYALSDRWMRYENKDKDLQDIRSILEELGKESRTMTPKHLSEPERTELAIERRARIRHLRQRLAPGGQMAKCITRSLPSDTRPTEVSLRGDAIRKPVASTSDSCQSRHDVEDGSPTEFVTGVPMIDQATNAAPNPCARG